MARNPDREYDKTALTARTHGYVVHRDYAAHFFRWSFISARMIGQKTRVLDIGCGVDCAMAKTLAHYADNTPASYLGVDFNKLRDVPKRAWSDFIGEFNFADRWHELKKRGPFDVIVCLEVVEHMRPPAVLRLLRGAGELLADGGRLILSTPVYNGKRMANNHINEMTIPQMREAFAATGWNIVKRWGTFMSDGDRKKCATPEENALCERLREYYNGDVVACFLAPLYPDHSRNNVWMCERDSLADIL